MGVKLLLTGLILLFVVRPYLEGFLEGFFDAS